MIDFRKKNKKESQFNNQTVFLFVIISVIVGKEKEQKKFNKHKQERQKNELIFVKKVNLNSLENQKF